MCSSTKLQKNLLLLRSKKKAGKSGNMMNFFFKTKKMQVKVAR